MRTTFLIIIGGIILTALLFAPGVVFKKCPLGLTDDPFPGSCPLFTDQNKDGLCDFSQFNLAASSLDSTEDLSLGALADPVIWVLLLLLIIGVSFTFYKRFLWIRFITLAIGLIYLGFIKAATICPLATFQNIFLVKEKIVGNLVPFIIFLLPLVFALIFGKIFCRWACPLGAFQEFIYKIRLIFKFSKNRKPLKIHKNFFYLKYFILIVVIFSVIGFRKSVLCGIDPFGALFGIFRTPISLITLVVLIGVSFLIFRPWCGYICPYGALIDLFTKIKIIGNRSLQNKIIGGMTLILILIIPCLYLFTNTGGNLSSSRPLLNTEGLEEAMYYELLPGGKVRCNLCPTRCVLKPGQIGVCKVRQNIDGKLYSLSYGNLAAAHIDPIEKKPLFHFLPGTQTFSIATPGCNLHCLYCQNWQIAQVMPGDIKTIKTSPEEVVEKALVSGAESIAFTYSEPIIFYEYMLDISKLAHQKGLKVVMISCGYIEEEPLRNLCQYMDAIKIDLKAFDENFYREFTGGHLNSILNSLKIIKEEGVWLEIVNLLIPGENDSEEEIRQMARWIKENLGSDVPVHFSRFHPDYKLRNLPPTPIESLKRARRVALEEGLNYVYTGNFYWPEGEITYCPETGEPAIIRQGFFVTENNLENGKCSNGEEIPGVWK